MRGFGNLGNLGISFTGLGSTSNFSVTGGQTFTLDATWDNGSGISTCASNQVAITR